MNTKRNGVWLDMLKYQKNAEPEAKRNYTIYSVDIETRKIEIVRFAANMEMMIPDTDSADEVLAAIIECVVSDQYKDAVKDFVQFEKWPSLLKDKNSADIVYQDKKNHWRRLWIVPSKLDNAGEVSSAIMCIRDISDDREREERKNAEIEAAKTDQLTGLGNRTVFYEVIKKAEFGSSENYPRQFGIVFVDINGLKERNDAAGHEAGDALILDVADILLGIFDREYVYRHGGDEFMVISFDRDPIEFDKKLKKLMQSWTEDVSAAVGGVWVKDVSDIDDYILRADMRMYMDKNRFYHDKKNDRRDYDKAFKLDVGLKYVPFEGITFGNENRYFYVTDLNTNMTRWSSNSLSYFGLSGEYIADADKEWGELVHPNDRQMVVEDLQKILSGEKQLHEMNYRVRNRDGQYITCTCRGKTISNPSGEGYLFVGAVENHEISGGYDSITGLGNVFSFLIDTEKCINRDKSDTVLAIGINSFSGINNRHGYGFGNKLLRKFAEILRETKTDRSKAYRIDGTKFCLALDGGTIDEAKEIFAELKGMVHRGLWIDGKLVPFNISGGVVAIDKSHAVDPQSILSSIEYTIGQSKRIAHSDLVVFNDFASEKNKENLMLIDMLRNSVYEDMDGFHLCYQPVVNAVTGRITGAEALLRWGKEPFGEVSPAIFIPMLESDPCFFELGEWIFRTALTDAKAMLEIDKDFIININVSAEQIERSGFRKSIVKILEETGFPPQNLCMELTERVISLDIGYLRNELEYFKSLGIRIALDDFGTGISSMNLLLDLSIDQIKIDRKFVKDIVTNRTEQAIVQAIASCANNLSLEVCIEGVENIEMKEFLMQYYVTKHQGYYYSKPIVFDAIIEKLKNN